MRLHTLLANIDDAEGIGDITGASPAFAVLRNEASRIDSPDAWYAVSIVSVGVRPETGVVSLVVDSSDSAVDINVDSLRNRLTELAGDSLGFEVVVDLSVSEDGFEASTGDQIVDTYADENGLGLMVWFDGYEDWISTQD